MKKLSVGFILIISLALAGCEVPVANYYPSQTIGSQLSNSASSSALNTPTQAPSDTASSTNANTAENTATGSATATATSTGSAAATGSATATATPVPTPTPTPKPVNKETIVPVQLLKIGPWYPEKQPEAGYNMPYAIEVDVTNQCVNIYVKNEETGLYDEIINRFVCSTGLKSTPTPLGVVKMNRSGRKQLKDRWKYFSKWDCYAQYATRITGPYLFHSFSFMSKSEKNPSMYSYNNLGKRASAGCVRLLVEHSKWIYDNVDEFTFVNITQGKKEDKTLRTALKVPKYGEPVTWKDPTPTATPTVNPTATPTPTPTPTPTQTPTLTPTPTPTPTPTQTQAQTQTATSTPELTPTQTQEVTATNTVTSTQELLE